MSEEPEPVIIAEEFKGLWLRFFTAALCGVVAQDADSSENHAREAAQIADAALEEYKERFL